MPLGQQLAPHLPFLRRYARALTGDQTTGDAVVRAALQAIAEDRSVFPEGVDPKLGLYRVFQTVRARDGGTAPSASGGDDVEGIAQARLSNMRPETREALLLSTMEGFAPEDVGYLMDVPASEVTRLVEEANAEIERQTRAQVMIVEDEPLIAMDIETIVRDLGHDVVGIAVTRDEAVGLAGEKDPTLILADIHLADQSSGIDAVKDILARTSVPVIFITAYPERLLTGERPEPTFLITKPFQRSTVKATIAQALFFDKATLPEA